MINTKDIKGSGEGSTPKSLQPGNHTCTINNVRLEEFKFVPNSYHIIISLEGPALGEGFEGFFIDKDNEAKGRHKGQVADVKATEYAFADGTTKSGIQVSRDNDMLKFLKNFCTALGIDQWLIDQDGKHATIESLFNAFSKEKPYAKTPLDYCLGGKEYTNKSGYTAYDLFLPKFSKDGAPFGSRVVKYSEALHIRKKKVESVSEFGNDTSASADFQLD